MEQKEETPGTTYQVRVSHNALRNIDEIVRYIAFENHQPDNAVRIGDRIFETIDRIGNHPFAFKVCEQIPSVARQYRQAICSSWLIIYRVSEMEIVILGIIHSAMKPTKIRSLRKIK